MAGQGAWRVQADLVADLEQVEQGGVARQPMRRLPVKLRQRLPAQPPSQHQPRVQKVVAEEVAEALVGVEHRAATQRLQQVEPQEQPPQLNHPLPLQHQAGRPPFQRKGKLGDQRRNS